MIEDEYNQQKTDVINKFSLYLW